MDDLIYDEEFYFDDVELFNDLDIASPSDWLASISNAEPITLSTIHDDLQLLNVTIILIYIVLFVFFIVQKWR